MKAISVEEIKTVLKEHGALIGMGERLEKLGYKTDFQTDPICYIKIIGKDKNFMLVNKKYVTEATFVVGEIAGGWHE